MNRASTWTVGLVWAAATMAAGWAIGDLQGAMILAVGSGVLLWLFLALWRGSTLAGALLTFGVPTLMVASGALAFGMGHRSVGNALMVGSGAMWALLAGWVLTRCSSGEYVAGFAPDGEDGEFVTHDEWAKAGWGRGKTVPSLPAFRTDSAICPFMEKGAINPNAGRADRWTDTGRHDWLVGAEMWSRSDT